MNQTTIAKAAAVFLLIEDTEKEMKLFVLSGFQCNRWHDIATSTTISDR